MLIDAPIPEEFPEGGIRLEKISKWNIKGERGGIKISKELSPKQMLILAAVSGGATAITATAF